ncbi:hypothetical protein TALK_17725 [Thalassospira alkalitolerans]|uniref:Tetratricopeptide repeat protein n=1 Tax=Thalassospira alkalitolerans TaxID=1293890 RepID=A0A1Y2L7L2_9PROT|nr:hypothetical protein TALK_17725 [Thalassospira alkalitolerans]
MIWHEDKQGIVKVYFGSVGFLVLFLSFFNAPLAAAKSLTLCDEIGSLGFDDARVSRPVPIEDYNPFDVAPACEKALVAEPENPRFHFQLGVAMALLLNPDKALEHLEIAAAKDYDAAHKFLKMFDKKMAEQMNGSSSQSADNSDTVLDQCDRIGAIPIDTRSVGQPVPHKEYNAQAVEVACRKALEANPDNPRFHFQLGMALLGTGKVSDALDHLKFAADNNYVAARLALAKFDENMGK